MIFGGTIHDNLTLGSRDELQDISAKIDECVEFAALNNVISSLPDGLQTIVGPTGHGLSGGQTQRLALARAKLRDPHIVVFDEVTNALDQQTAEQVMNHIRDWRENKTTIIITHDLTQVRFDDYLYVLDQGRVAQEGYRHTLEFDASGPFSKLLSPRSESSEDSMGPLDDPLLENESLIPDCASNLSQNAKVDVEASCQPKEPNGSCRIPPAQLKDSLKCQQCNRVFEKDIDEQTSNHQQFKFLALHLFSIAWSYLDSRQRMKAAAGFLAATLHAAAIPTFSWCFSRLLGTLVHSSDLGAYSAISWSLMILCIAVVDGFASYFMQRLLEECDQVWVTRFRGVIFKRVLSQPCLWFYRRGNRALDISSCLDRDAEELKILLSRLLGSVFVVVLIMLTALMWSATLCLSLTIFSLCCVPFLYMAASIYESTNQQWQLKCHSFNQAAVAIFSETFENIQHVRALTAESQLRQQHTQAAAQALTMGIKKAVWAGVWFGCTDACSMTIIGEF